MNAAAPTGGGNPVLAFVDFAYIERNIRDNPEYRKHMNTSILPIFYQEPRKYLLRCAKELTAFDQQLTNLTTSTDHLDALRQQQQQQQQRLERIEEALEGLRYVLMGTGNIVRVLEEVGGLGDGNQADFEDLERLVGDLEVEIGRVKGVMGGLEVRKGNEAGEEDGDGGDCGGDGGEFDEGIQDLCRLARWRSSQGS